MENKYKQKNVNKKQIITHIKETQNMIDQPQPTDIDNKSSAPEQIEEMIYV